VAKGFGVSKGSQGLAPSGLQYDPATDTLYIVDGVTNTIVAFSNSSKLLDKDEIIVKAGGKTFSCKYPKTTCASLVYSGSPLDAPMASALLPNGNLIVANTQGTANTLVELTPQGQVLDTKVVDSSSTQGVFGLVAGGTKDSNTVLFFTDTNSNNVQELEQ
jgi:sugar lactone lactonase YvrE